MKIKLIKTEKTKSGKIVLVVEENFLFFKIKKRYLCKGQMVPGSIKLWNWVKFPSLKLASLEEEDELNKIMFNLHSENILNKYSKK